MEFEESPVRNVFTNGLRERSPVVLKFNIFERLFALSSVHP